MMELALLSPWICFLFVGVLDSGFYAYSLITLETATRSAAAFNSDANTPSDSAKVCTIVLDEMRTRPHTETLVVPHCGHAPMLMDDFQAGAIRKFLLGS